MAVLVLAEHDGKALKPATLHTVAAAAKLGDAGDDIHGQNECSSAGKLPSLTALT